MREVLKAAAASHDVSVSEIISPSRSRSVVAARRAAWRILVSRGWSRADIARAFGVDWSSVHHAVKP